EDVDPAKVLLDLPDERGRCFRVRDVAGIAAMADTGKRRGRLLGPLRRAADHGDARSGARQVLGDRATDPARRPGNERYLPLELACAHVSASSSAAVPKVRV